jgi:ABC-type transport system involved in cytochrome c biogenesis permease subunit
MRYHACMFGPLGMSLTALGLYGAAEAFSIGHLRTNRDGYGQTATILLLLGFLVHFLALEVGGRATGTVPYQNLPGSLSLFAWMLAAAYGVLFLRHREGSTGPFLIPLVILFMAGSLVVYSSPTSQVIHDPRRSGSLFAMHVTLAILGYAALTLSFVLAQMYLLQTRQLHKHKLGLLFSRLPALDVLTRMHRTSVAMGALALAVASCLGMISAKRNWGTYWDPKVAFTLLLILVFVFTLIAPRLGWGGKKIAWTSIFGFVLLVFSYSVVNLFITAEHVFR